MRNINIILSSLLSFSLGVHASDCWDKHFNMYNSVYLQSVNVQAKNAEKSENTTVTKRSFNNRMSFTSDYITANTDIELYDITNAPNDLKNISLPYDGKANLEEGYQINALYATLKLGDFEFHHGSIPFKGGRFEEIKNPTVNGGNGLAIINNQVYSSDFLSYKTDLYDGRFALIGGYSEFNTKNRYNGLLYRNEGSNGTYILSTYENGKHFFELDYFNMHGKYDTIEPWHIKVGGFGYIYDDSMDSGLTLYTNLGMSQTDDRVRDIMKSYKITSTAVINYLRTQGATVDNQYNKIGYAGLFGLNYEFDKGNQTYNIGVEYFKTKGSWVSTNHGVVFNSDHSWYANHNANEYIVYAGVDLSQNLRVQTKFSHTDSDTVPGAFSITEGVEQDKAYHKNDFYRHFSKAEFMINYKF